MQSLGARSKEARMARGAAFLVVVFGAVIGLDHPAHGDTPYYGETKIFAYSFCPVGWLPADGRTLAILDNDVLFNLIGTTYGGDGQETFVLPDLRGRLPLGTGQGPGLSNRAIGESGGAETVTLTQAQLPPHSHWENATTLPPNVRNPAAALPAQKSRTPIYRIGDAGDALRAADSIGSAGGSQPHENMAPFTAFTICISNTGLYPPQN
jgi:microcystin-dependent protein